MRGLRRRGFAAGDAGKLTDKSKVLRPPTHMRLTRGARHRSGDAGCRHLEGRFPVGSRLGRRQLTAQCLDWLAAPPSTPMLSSALAFHR